MNPIVSALCRNLSCAAAAVTITLVFAVSFVQSTSLPPGMHAAARSAGHLFIAVQPRHAWFGQPEPAVLVD